MFRGLPYAIFCNVPISLKKIYARSALIVQSSYEIYFLKIHLKLIWTFKISTFPDSVITLHIPFLLIVGLGALREITFSNIYANTPSLKMSDKCQCQKFQTFWMICSGMRGLVHFYEKSRHPSDSFDNLNWMMFLANNEGIHSGQWCTLVSILFGRLQSIFPIIDCKSKHRKNCECCPCHSSFKGRNVIFDIVVLIFQKCNQCKVSGH